MRDTLLDGGVGIAREEPVVKSFAACCVEFEIGLSHRWSPVAVIYPKPTKLRNVIFMLFLISGENINVVERSPYPTLRLAGW